LRLEQRVRWCVWVAGAGDMSASASMSVDPLSMKSVLDRVELLEKSYQEERLAVSAFATLLLALLSCRPVFSRALTCFTACPRVRSANDDRGRDHKGAQRGAPPL
jgi:hypothetical protein